MAIIENNGFNGMRKSIGNMTFRRVNGQTIASAKIWRNKSNTPKQAARRSSFSRLGKLGAALRQVIDIGFDRPKRGSKFNNFTRCNTDLGNFLTQYNPDAYDRLPLLMLWQVLNDERFMGQVFASRGNMNCLGEFLLDEEGQINGLISLSRNFIPGDMVTIAACIITTTDNQKLPIIDPKTHILGSSDIEALHHPQELIVTKRNWPELNINTFYSKPATFFGAVMAAIVTNGTDRASSVFTLLKQSIECSE
jgi:hypothetical protein